MHYVQIIINGLNWVAVNAPWTTIATVAALTGFLTIPNKLLKKLFTDDMQHRNIMQFVVVPATSIVMVGAEYIASTPTANLSLGLGVIRSLAIAYSTQPFWRFIVRPLISWIVARYTEAQALNAAKATPATVTATTSGTAKITFKSFSR
jgi:hypothetical protein